MEASSFTPEPAPPHRGDGERVCTRSRLCKASQKQGAGEGMARCAQFWAP